MSHRILVRVLAATLVLLNTSLAQENQWHSDALVKGEWRRSGNWTLGVPKVTHTVVINQSAPDAFTRVRRLAAGARAASVAVGSGVGGAAELRLVADGLEIVASPDIDGSGRLTIGDSGGSGRVLHKSSWLRSDGFVVVGHAGGNGTLRMEQGAELDAGGLLVADDLAAIGRVVVVGGTADLLTEELVIGAGDARMNFIADPGISRVHVLNPPQLAGGLTVNLRSLETAEAEVVLIDNLSTQEVQGGFTDVEIINPDHGYYELTYSGGDGNDVAVVRSDLPVNDYDRWIALHFGSEGPSEVTRPAVDFDSDGLSNATEYALGRSPVHDEGSALDVNSRNEAGFTVTEAFYVLRSDRADVRLYPQGRPAGGIWLSSFDVSTVSTDGDRTTMLAAATTVASLEVRLVADLLPNAEQLNVLFVIVDDLSDWVGCLGGNPQARTPNIDRLASRGLLFREAHAAATICNPSRVAILTGVRPSSSGVYRNPQELRQNSVLQSAATIPGHFRGNGYRSLGSGKIFHDPDPVSWDEYWPSIDYYRPDDPLPPNRPLNGITTRGNAFDWGPLSDEPDAMGDHQIATWTGGRLHTLATDEPFFLGCGFFRPHLPFYVPQRYFDLFDFESVELPPVDPDDLLDLPTSALVTINDKDHNAVTAADQWRQGVHAYLASVAFVDEQVGRVLDELDRSPHARNTIVVFLSDHGFVLGEKRHWRKQVLWDQVTHVPMIVVAPGITQPGSVCDSVVSLIDVFPTLIELCDLPQVNNLDGSSLVPMLSDPGLTRPAPVLTTRYRKQHSVRDERYHLIQYSDGQRELYDLWLDPFEWTNLIGERSTRKIVKRLKKSFPDHNARSNP